MFDATVDITQVVMNTEVIQVRDLSITDRVFDIWGNIYGLTSVKHLKTKVNFTRDDGQEGSFFYKDYEQKEVTMSVLRRQPTRGVSSQAGLASIRGGLTR